MDIKIQIIIAIIVMIAIVIIVNMIRRKGLELKYALMWLGVGAGVLILDCFPQLLTYIAHAIGIATPINMLFFLGFCFSLFIIFGLTITVSRMSVQIKQLAQELAVFEKEQKKDSLDRTEINSGIIDCHVMEEK